MLKTKEYRCDEAMRRSKEKARAVTLHGYPKWKCRSECQNCVCGMVKLSNGTWEHNGRNYD